MEYQFREIEKKWQQRWKEGAVYSVSNKSDKPKCYVLDMFPYPSGAGLHVGHPLGYIASDIYSRYKRLKGFNVLHPMGYDAFGLPAEQYAIEHGIHPAVSTDNNIENFRKQLDNIGFSFDWEREIRTSDPQYYKWTQWIFLQLFKSYFNRNTNKAESMDSLIKNFEKEGNKHHPIPNSNFLHPVTNASLDNFTSKEWKGYDEKTQQDILMEYRLAYCGIGEVNWCEALGTVLANDEVINGVSERGGHPVVRKKLRQWYLRITEYADRLLEGLNKVDFSDAMKEMQSNWIGKSYGAELEFGIRLTPSPSPGGEGGRTARQFKTVDKSYWGILKKYGRENRKDPTEAEDILWQRLRNNKLGAKVRRQHAIQGYIVDFAILEVKLVVEVDGEYHNEEEQRLYDEARTNFLNELEIDLIRFSNDEVINNTDDVVKKIKAAIDERKRQHTTKVEQPLLRQEKGEGDEARLRVFTTRPDTIFGVDFMVIAPEHELVRTITTEEHRAEVEKYLEYVNSRNERERMAEKKISGVFTGAYAINPFDQRKIPVWISEYVLAGYGTGAIMAVPCGDQRDFLFAKHFNIPITNIIGSHYNGEEANPTKDAILENSGFINGIVMKDAIDVVIKKVEEIGIGVRKVNYKMRDAAFSRQRYWGEPIPILWKKGIAHPLDESELPVVLPHLDELKPGPDAEGPLSNLTEWKNYKGGIREVNTMPGYAGSSWYFLRYMDPNNDKEFCSRNVSDYWGQVDIYIGGTEHAVGHLLYSRMWTKCLYDLGLVGFEEPYKKLVNQGMIQGSSRIIFRVQLNSGYNDDKDVIASVFVSSGQVQKITEDNLNLEEIKDLFFKDFEIKQEVNGISIGWLHVDVNIVDDHYLNINLFRKWKSEYGDAHFIFEDGSSSFNTPDCSDKKFICRDIVEKMSKRYYNVVNPDDLCNKYGADTFRMYEMFLGPVEMSKPWDTKGIEGVFRFLKKFWRLFYDETKGNLWNEEKVTDAELKVLHKTIKKIAEDTERFSFNTAVSAFMIATNELTDLKCHKREILEPLLILLAPYAPHITDELWSLMGHKEFILAAAFPEFKEKYVAETTKAYPVAINGKTRTELTLSLDATQQQVEEMVLQDTIVQKWLEGKAPKKIIYVKNKMINVVI